MKPSLQISRRTAVIGLAASGLSLPTLAQSYPTRPVTLVVTFAAGGGVDVVARLVSESLGERIGQRIVIDNRAGGATITGSQAVVKAPPDGYLLLAAPTTMVINPAVRAQMPFDWSKELVPIGLMAKLPFVVVTKADSPLNSMKDLEILGKTRANPALFASGGTGTVAHLAGELFALRSGAKMQHVPYRGEGPSLADVAGGVLDVTFATATAASALVLAGTLKALGVTTAERSPLLPNVPTVTEQGYSDFDVSAWVGLMAPTGTSADVMTKLSAGLASVLADKVLRDRLERAGAVPAQPGFAFASFLQREASTWSAVIRDSGIKIEP